jgi:NAD-dependent deacetylase
MEGLILCLSFYSELLPFWCLSLGSAGRFCYNEINQLISQRKISRRAEPMDNEIIQVSRWIQDAKNLVILTGAGLSTESGIPDFRSPGGVWDRYNPEDFDYQNFMARESAREKYWQMATEMYQTIQPAQPNPAHLAIADLERLGKLDLVITQNIDGLHFKAGNSREKVIEIHGSTLSVTCQKCGKAYERDEIQRRLREGIKVPYCDDCQGPLKPSTISFGQAMPERETRQAFAHASASDLFMVIGSSLVVQPAASLPMVAKRNGARLVIINRDATPLDSLADLVIQDQAGPTMTRIVEAAKEGISQ